MNGYRQEGMGRMDMTIRDGRRWSAARAYLRPGQDAGPTCSILTGCLATRVLIESGRAIGVDYAERPDSLKRPAEREVILAGGAINSPQLLMLSGIGPTGRLRSSASRCTHLPGVGRNLQDHLEFYSSRVHEPITLLKAMRPPHGRHRPALVPGQ